MRMAATMGSIKATCDCAGSSLSNRGVLAAHEAGAAAQAARQAAVAAGAGAGTFGGGCCGTCRPPVNDVVT